MTERRGHEWHPEVGLCIRCGMRRLQLVVGAADGECYAADNVRSLETMQVVAARNVVLSWGLEGPVHRWDQIPPE